jgi:hypothetical protein
MILAMESNKELLRRVPKATDAMAAASAAREALADGPSECAWDCTSATARLRSDGSPLVSYACWTSNR